MIWRETFPQTRHEWTFGRRKQCCCHFLRYRRPPISACINHESRSETLMQYQFLNACSRICSPIGEGPRRRPQTTFWNGERDIVRFSFFWMQDLGLEKFWRDHFDNDLNAVLASVRTLELRISCWNDYHKNTYAKEYFNRLRQFT
jgi:hypothetical protein